MAPTDTEARFIAAVRARSPRARVELRSADCQAMIDRDAELARTLAGEADASPMVRIWTNQRCLVASSSQARHPAFADAAATMADRGWRVAVRKSAGTSVIHRPGVVNVSLFLPGTAGINIRAGYDALLDLLAASCADLGVLADMGWVPGSICDGRYNLRHGRRKLAGTAAFVRPHGARHIQVVHASVMVAGDIIADLAAISAFDRIVGQQCDYAADWHITLEAAAAQRAQPKRFHTSKAPRRCFHRGTA